MKATYSFSGSNNVVVHPMVTSSQKTALKRHFSLRHPPHFLQSANTIWHFPRRLICNLMFDARISIHESSEQWRNEEPYCTLPLFLIMDSPWTWVLRVVSSWKSRSRLRESIICSVSLECSSAEIGGSGFFETKYLQPIKPRWMTYVWSHVTGILR